MVLSYCPCVLSTSCTWVRSEKEFVVVCAHVHIHLSRKPIAVLMCSRCVVAVKGWGAEAGSKTLDVCVPTPWELDCRCSHKQRGRVHRPTSVHLWDQAALISLHMIHLFRLQLQGGGHACLSWVWELMYSVPWANGNHTPTLQMCPYWHTNTGTHILTCIHAHTHTHTVKQKFT